MLVGVVIRRVRRTRGELVPPLSWDAVTAAAARVRELRSEAGDPELAAFPFPLVDDDDVLAAVRYLARPPRVPDQVLAAELGDRARLVEYLHQQASARHDRHVLGILETGRKVGAPPRTYGPVLGYHHRQALHQRWRALTQLVRGVPAPAAPIDAGVQAWLDEHAGQLGRVAEALVDHRETWLQLAGQIDRGPAAELPRYVAEAIDHAGMSMGRRPTRAHVGAVMYAVFLLRAVQPGDPVLDEALRLGLGLREQWNRVTESIDA